MTTVTREQSGGETPELLVPPPHPSMLGAAGGQQLDPISEESRAEESREDQQDTSNRSTGEEQSGNVGTKPKQKTVEDCVSYFQSVLPPYLCCWFLADFPYSPQLCSPRM